MKTRFTHGSALLHEDVVTPLHHHNEADDCLMVDTGDGVRAMSPCEADGYVTETFATPELNEVEHHQEGPRGIKRRHILQGTAAGFGALLLGSALPRYSFADTPTGSDHLLVCVFLRGGFDGLSAVVPLNDPGYLAARPTIAVRPEQTIGLSNEWGLNHNMSALKPLWDAGELAIVQGAGSPDVTRSHFQDQATVERAAPPSMRSGWLGRHLQTASSETGTFRGVTVGHSAVFSLATTALNTLAVSSIEAFDLRVYSDEASKQKVRSSLTEMYRSAEGEAQRQAEATFSAIDTLQAVRAEPRTTVPDAGYPDSDWGRGLAEIARLAKANLGVEVACIDLGDWDMHQQLGLATNENDWFSRKSREFAAGLAAFRKDMGDRWASTTVVTMSEFGRRVAENGDTGLDHGQGNTMFITGGGIRGGQVYGTVPELLDSNLPLGDVPITVDYRQALSEVVANRLGNGAKLGEIFPDFTPGASLGIA